MINGRLDYLFLASIQPLDSTPQLFHDVILLDLGRSLYFWFAVHICPCQRRQWIVLHLPDRFRQIQGSLDQLIYLAFGKLKQIYIILLTESPYFSLRRMI